MQLSEMHGVERIKKGIWWKKWVKLTMSLFFLHHFPFSIMWIWDEVGGARTVFFDKFQGCNLLGDKPGFKRRDETYKRNQTPLPAQYLFQNFSLDFLSRLVISATSFHFHLIYYIYFKRSYNVLVLAFIWHYNYELFLHFVT